MASSSSERVDLRRLGADMGVEITSTSYLVEAIKAGQSCLPIVGRGAGSEGWRAEKIQSIADAPFLWTWEKYHIPYNIELLAPSPDEQACYSRSGCVFVSEFLLKVELRIPLHPFFSAILRLYGLAPKYMTKDFM